MLSLWPLFFYGSTICTSAGCIEIKFSTTLHLAHFIIRMAVLRHNFNSFWIFFQILKIQSLDISLQYHRTLTSNREGHCFASNTASEQWCLYFFLSSLIVA